jgi:hyperosmotically inducible periplasmic protein
MRLLLALVAVGVVVYFITQWVPAPLQRSSGDSGAVSAAPAPERKSPRMANRERPVAAGSIRDELSRTGEVVRDKARVAGEAIDDARLIAVVKSKLALDSELSALEISVTAHDGRVTLEGMVSSEALIARAVDLALHTDGVHHVQSRLQIGEPPPRR